MKLLCSILLILILTWQGIFQSGLMVYWAVNRSFIASTLCENRNKPMLHCNGKCYLEKQIKRTDEKEEGQKSVPDTFFKLKSAEFYTTTDFVNKVAESSLDLSKVYSTYISGNASSGFLQVFSPPPENAMIV